MGDIMKKAPNALIWAVTICFISILAALVALSFSGADTTELWAFVNRLTNIGSVLLSGGAVIASGAAQRTAQEAVEQTNGQLDARIQAAVARALEQNR